MNLDVLFHVQSDFHQEPRACQEWQLRFCGITPPSHKWAGECVPGIGSIAASLATLTDSCLGLAELVRTGITKLHLPRVGTDVPCPARTYWGSGIEGMDSSTGRVQCGLGDAVVGGLGLTASPGHPQPGSQEQQW